MNTIYTVLILIFIFSSISLFIGHKVLKIIGLPGELICRNTYSKKDLKYILGLLVSMLGHLYIYLSFMVFTIEWTRLRIDVDGFPKYLIWFFVWLQLMVQFKKAIKMLKPKTNFQELITHLTFIFMFKIRKFYLY